MLVISKFIPYYAFLIADLKFTVKPGFWSGPELLQGDRVGSPRVARVWVDAGQQPCDPRHTDHELLPDERWPIKLCIKHI